MSRRFHASGDIAVNRSGFVPQTRDAQNYILDLVDMTPGPLEYGYKEAQCAAMLAIEAASSSLVRAMVVMTANEPRTRSSCASFRRGIVTSHASLPDHDR